MTIDMNKLICSFKSDLPNEIDFAMQVATLLANTENFSWSSDYQLVDAICSSLHVFSCVCKDDTITSLCDCYPRFWHKLLTNNHSNNVHLQAATLPPDTEQSYLRFADIRDHDFEDHGRIYRRIKTSAELVKQFSMTCDITHKTEKTHEINPNIYTNQHNTKKKLKASPPLLKFVSLLLFCDDKPLNLIGLDILSNIASKLSKLPESTDDLTCLKLVQMFQEHCIENICCQDGDIYIIIRSIEVISRLISSSSSRVYSHTVTLIYEKSLLLRIEQLLTSRNDVNLFLAALECFYRISRHQPHLINSSRAQHLIKILVNLLNCEDEQFFTSNALKRIELIGLNEYEDWDVPMQPIETINIPPVSRSTAATTTAPTQPTHQNKRTTNNIKTNTVTNGLTTSRNGPVTTVVANSISSPIVVNSVSAPVVANPTVAPTTSMTNGSQQSQPQVPIPQAPTVQPSKEYICEWNNCKTKFSEPKLVYTHVFEVHIGALAQDQQSSCLWTGPNGTGPGCIIQRPKFSLLTHLNDFHCNTAALERASSRSEPIKPPKHPGYGPNAALLAIKRHANLEKGVTRLPNRSPLSVSVRLTAALILRNLASESSEMKQALGYHEPLLSEICMTNGRDESKIIAECLSLFSDE